MLKQQLARIKESHLRALREQKGQSLIIFTFAFLGLIAMLGIALDLGLVYIEQVRVSRTTDAATLAGVVELPFEEDAMRRAIEFIELNGYQPGVDANIVVRGCMATLETTDPGTGTVNTFDAGSGFVQNPGNVSELGFDSPITTTTAVTGALVTQYITAEKPRATFLIDTLSYQPEDGGCDPDGAGLFGNSNKLEVRGVVNVRMNFMQFFGFGQVPVQDVAVAENITNLDVAVVFDISGSMEFETTCFDCWVRTDPNNPDYPNNGYFNPLPYNPDWADVDNDGVTDFQQSIPNSPLCTAAPTSIINGSNRYLVHEAELYSREVGNWDLDVRTQGQGFWVLQRGSHNANNALNPDENGFDQGNQAGNPNNQSSNVCKPAVSGIDCTMGGADNVCLGGDGGVYDYDEDGVLDDIAVDCSGYIKAHPYPTYSQGITNDPKLQGAAYDLTCWTGGNTTCWDGNALSDPTRPSQGLVPYVEYDFTPDWSGNTYIWIRAIGGGRNADKWNGLSPAALQDWWGQVYWQLGSGAVQGSIGETATPQVVFSNYTKDNRARNGDWRWIRLTAAPVSVTAGTQQVFRLYQGSAGYKIDKIIFTNDSSNPPTVLAQDGNRGPAATPGSATRESCNLCNPAFGYTVDPADCTCRLSATDTANGGYGSGGNTCFVAPITQTNQLRDYLYRGVEPLRSAQEAVKNFAKRLNPQFDQIAIVPFTEEVKDETPVSGQPSRSKLQCLQWAKNNLGDARNCYDPTFTTTPLSFTLVLEALERQWPQGSTNISEGLREGLQELGVEPYASNSNCSLDVTDDTACDRRGAARKVLILLTDGSPNENAGNCAPGGGRPDLWNGDVGPTSDDYECAVYFGERAADAGVIVYTIGLGAGASKDLLTAIAEGYDPHSNSGAGEEFLFDARGGRYFNAAKPTDLDGIFSQILSNIYVRIVG